MSNRRSRTVGVLATVAALAAVLVPGSSSAGSAAAPTYEAAGTSYSPSGAGATNWWHLPTLATAKVGSATRLFRGAMTSGTDDGRNISFVNQYLDLGSTAGWTTIKGYTEAPGQPPGFEVKGERANFENFVADGSTLHTFDETTEGPDANGKFRVRHRVSSDGGVTWKTGYSSVDPSGTPVAPGGQFTLHGGVEVLRSGDWVIPVYTKRCLGNKTCIATDHSSYRLAIGLLTSSDKGASWTKPALPFVSAENHYTEATMARRADGKLLMVGRYDRDYPSALLGQLVFRVSDRRVDSAADLVGMTWSAPHITIPGVKQVNGLTLGSSPRLTRVGTQLMLTFGRPGNTVAWSTDGLGATWTNSHSLNPNRPTACDESQVHKVVDRIADLPCDAMGSSGYMRTAVVDHAAGVGYIVGDRCHVWSCETPGQASWPDVTWANQAESAIQAVWLVRFTAP